VARAGWAEAGVAPGGGGGAAGAVGQDVMMGTGGAWVRVAASSDAPDCWTAVVVRWMGHQMGPGSWGQRRDQTSRARTYALHGTSTATIACLQVLPAQSCPPRWAHWAHAMSTLDVRLGWSPQRGARGQRALLLRAGGGMHCGA
jgi:hypothetical protein